MKLVLVLTIEAVAPMVTGEVAATGGEDREDIKTALHLSLLKTHKTYL